MAKDFPYYRWWVRDAATDEKYAAMNYEERGFYRDLLDVSWVNGGLPENTTTLAGIMKVNRRVFDRLWAKVGQCWYRENGRLFNRRLEEERTWAFTKSENNKRPGNANASRTRSDVNAVDSRIERESSQRASGSVSVSGSVVVDCNKEKAFLPSETGAKSVAEVLPSPSRGPSPLGRAPLKPILSWEKDIEYLAFSDRYKQTGASIIDADFADAWNWSWKILDFEQKAKRVQALEYHFHEYSSDPRYVPKPQAFIDREWQRPLRPGPKNGTGAARDADAIRQMRESREIREGKR